MSFPTYSNTEAPIGAPMTPPLLRSLSKSSPRNPSQKLHLPPKAQAPRTEDDIKVQPQSVQDDQSIWPSDDTTHAPLAKVSSKPRSHLHLELLPAEVLETIAGYLVGRLGSTNAAGTGSETLVRNWNEHMRHPRRRDAGNLALVSRTWRELIQERLYRHGEPIILSFATTSMLTKSIVKVQGTMVALNECSDFFLSSPHLQTYVRHLQIISPIWEMKRGVQTRNYPVNVPPVPQDEWTFTTPQETVRHGEPAQIFQLASGNATVEEIFSAAKVLFPDLSALTIEAGHCKRPPQMKYFRPGSRRHSIRQPSSRDSVPADSSLLPLAMPQEAPHLLPELPKVTALMIKGAWNVVRAPSDFELLCQALPRLKEFHCNFHALKCQAYTTMSSIIRNHWPNNITHLDIGLDGLYTKANSSLQKWRKIYPESHICLDFASRMPQLRSLTYTGRVCRDIFAKAPKAVPTESPSDVNTSLESIDLVVNNLCCDPLTYNDATGIHHLPFIKAFESLIINAVRSLQVFVKLNQIRIRFIDLDSPNPLLNPTFHLEKNRAWGLWSEEIIGLLKEARPGVRFLGMRGHLGTLLEAQELQEEPKRSTSVGYYRACAHGGALIH